MENTHSSSTTTTTYVDLILDPLFVAPNDHPGMNLSRLQFNETNFVNWSRQIKRGLAAKHKLSYIIGSVKQLEDVDSVEGQK